MFCTNCGKNLQPKMKFCPFCGTKTVQALSMPTKNIVPPAPVQNNYSPSPLPQSAPMQNADQYPASRPWQERLGPDGRTNQKKYLLRGLALAGGIIILSAASMYFIAKPQFGRLMPLIRSVLGIDEELPKGAFVLELPRVNDTRLGTELVTMDTLRYYVRARLLTEKLSRATPKNTSPEELAKLVQETAAAWKCTEAFAALSQKCAKILEREEKKPGYKPLAFLPSPAGSSLFCSVACAREGWGDERTPEQAEREDRERDIRDWEMRTNSPDLWAREICDTYRDAPAGNKLNALAVRLGTDAKTAKAELDKVSYQLGDDARKEATAYTVATNAALVTKASCQVALYFGTTALTCGATGPAAIAGGVNAVASGVDLIVDLSNTASELATEHTDPTLDKIKQYTGTISAITNIGALSTTAITTSMQDFAIRGKDAVTASQKALQSVGFGSHGALDSYNIASNGVNNWVTAGSWVKDRVDEARDGKVFGFKVGSTKKNNTVVYPTEFVPEDVPKPTPLAELPDKSLDAAIEESGSPPYEELSQEAQNLLDQSDAPQRIVKESGRDKDEQESGKDSGEASGEIADDSVYAPKNIAGATGSARETRKSYATVDYYDEESGKTEPRTEEMLTAYYTHHFLVVLSKEEAQGFFIEDKVKTTFSPIGTTNNSTHTFHVVSYDSGTGEGKLKCWVPATTKDGTFSFKISGKPGSMTIAIRNFDWAPYPSN